VSLFVLDTDPVSLLQRGHPIVVARVLATPPDELAVSVITFEEQRGACGRNDP
jgi:tRNA(fMet)-specific endonuclease VapC